jgi:phage tail-like protein
VAHPGNGQRSTFVGPGFGTLSRNGPDRPVEPPPVVSRRATLRDGLPAIYRRHDFSMRFVGALEGVLDPIGAVLDSLPAHFDADHASSELLDLLASWLGVEVHESHDVATRRALIHHATELARWRGTGRGLMLALRLHFPDLEMSLIDDGGVRWGDAIVEGERRQPASFVIEVRTEVPDERQAAIARCIEREKPVHAHYRLRVKRPKAPTT